MLILQLTRVGGLVAASGQQALPAEVTTQASFGKQPQRVNTEAPQLAPGLPSGMCPHLYQQELPT